MHSGLDVAISWSGGKDSALALHRALRQEHEPLFLLTMVNRDAGRSMSHGLDPALLRAQAQATGIPLVSREVTWESYEEGFKEAVSGLKAEGVLGVVFGDIDLVGHREWAERVCHEVGVVPLLPLWGGERRALLDELVESGFEAIIVAADADLLGEEWLGRRIDATSIDELARLGEERGIDPCGERGEFHTLVTFGPLFRRRILVLEAEPVLRDGYRFLDIQRFALEQG